MKHKEHAVNGVAGCFLRSALLPFSTKLGKFNVSVGFYASKSNRPTSKYTSDTSEHGVFDDIALACNGNQVREVSLKKQALKTLSVFGAATTIVWRRGGKHSKCALKF